MFKEKDIVLLQTDHSPRFNGKCELIIRRVRPESDCPYRCEDVHGQIGYFREDELRICMMPTKLIQEKV